MTIIKLKDIMDVWCRLLVKQSSIFLPTVYLPNSLSTHISLPPLHLHCSSGDGGMKAEAPAMQNANVNFAERPTLMPRSPWLAEKEQKDQLMCLHV